MTGRAATSRAATARRGGLLVLGAAVLWGTTGTAQALGPEATTPAGVGAVRLMVGAAGLLALAFVKDNASQNVSLPRHRAFWSLGLTALLGGAAVAAYQLAFFAAVARLGVALGTVVGIGSAPVFTGLLSALILRRIPDLRWVGATLAATVGVGVLLAPAGSVTVDAAGVAAALLAGGAYAGYTIAGKSLMDRGVRPAAAMAALFALGAVFTVPIVVLEPMAWLFSWHGLLLAAWLGLVTTTLSYVLFGRGLALVEAPTAATLSLAEPLTAAVLGVLVLTERPRPLQVLGAALVLLGLFLTMRRRKKIPPCE